MLNSQDTNKQWISVAKEMKAEATPDPRVSRCQLGASPASRGMNARLAVRRQPEGLSDSSRRPPGKSGATSGLACQGALHPARGARSSGPCIVVKWGLGNDRFNGQAACFALRPDSGTPAGVRRNGATFTGGRSPACPERPPATFFQSFGLPPHVPMMPTLPKQGVNEKCWIMPIRRFSFACAGMDQ